MEFFHICCTSNPSSSSSSLKPHQTLPALCMRFKKTHNLVSENYVKSPSYCRSLCTQHITIKSTYTLRKAFKRRREQFKFWSDSNLSLINNYKNKNDSVRRSGTDFFSSWLLSLSLSMLISCHCIIFNSCTFYTSRQSSLQYLRSNP